MTEKDQNSKSDAAKREEAVLEFWRENKIFEKSLEQTEGRAKGRASKKEFVFFEGPPTANGKPGIHHLEARAFKDAIPRYKTMQGFHVRRKGGWDTHGLPVELQVEKKLGLNSKKAIEEYGIAKFNRECKENVWEYLDTWNKFTKRIGFWVDQENPYVTYENNYIESVWNIVKEINKQKLLYKDYKVVPWCPRCGTALSSHELAQGYEDVKDLSVYVKFKIIGFDKAYFLAWTTTPWTLPGNVGLAVGKDIVYVEAKVGEEIFVLAKEQLSIITSPYEIIAEHKGKEMVGMQYEPLFSFLADTISESEKSKLEKAYKVYEADFVNTEDGTGIVHTAVMYGQDDFELGTAVGLPKHHLVNLEGKFIKGTGFLEGRFVKEKDANGKPTLDVDIIKYLTDKNLFFSKENYQHSYPHCWRCHTALIYYARDSWYIRMSDPKIKKQLISENKKINWEPEYIKEGRFGEWLREIKDWAISRERYWGTPLPVWQCADCKKIEVVGSIEELKEKTKKSGNKYFVMRHGEAENNVLKILSSDQKKEFHLTEKGKDQVKKIAEIFKGEKFDYIFTSPLVRTMETSNLFKKESESSAQIIVDERLREMGMGDFEGKEVSLFRSLFKNKEEEFKKRPDSVESFNDVKKRMMDFLYEIESKYKNKKILIVSHGDPIVSINVAVNNFSAEQAVKFLEENYPHKGQIKKLEFMPLPHNENYELDLHKPYIDEIKLICKCGGNLIRTKEVMDVWFDSGAMPFAQDHYPFDSKKWVDGKGYPADFICEAIDQTRGWFYTLHAIGILMGRGNAYKNVICLGHLMDANGKKMSKSLGNIVDPFAMIEKYGVDTLRLWMYSVNQPGESKNFDEKTVVLLQQQVFGLLYNVLAFYELYRDKEIEEAHLTPSPLSLIRRGVGERSNNILDQWILARLNELIKLSTENLDNYKLLEPVRAVRDFIGDLSTWYLRRSRERIKNGDKDAKSTLYFVLKTLAKIIAPFAPFTAEDIWLKLKNESDEESVHLAEWPKAEKIHSDILENMRITRTIVSLGLESRQKAKIQVRQPLSKLEVKNFNLGKEYIELIKDELNIKEIKQNKNLETEVLLDAKITPELKAEGDYREFMRSIQEKRKELNLAPSDKMALPIETIYKMYKIMPLLGDHMLRVAGVASMICDSSSVPIDKESVITACLLHDMGNIIKSDLNRFAEFRGEKSLEYWEQVKQDYIKKYGSNEHDASMKIARELGVSKTVLDLIYGVDFSNIPLMESKSIEYQICLYADARVDPMGIVSFSQRLREGRERYKNTKHTIDDTKWELVEQIFGRVEKKLFAKCKIKPEDINDNSAAPIISELKNFVIK